MEAKTSSCNRNLFRADTPHAPKAEPLLLAAIGEGEEVLLGSAWSLLDLLGSGWSSWLNLTFLLCFLFQWTNWRRCCPTPAIRNPP